MTQTPNTPQSQTDRTDPGLTAANGIHRPRLRFYHATPKGTGSALTMELHPAHDMTDGSIWLSAANQMSVGNRMGPNPTFSRFDWENKIVVKLDFDDLCQMLQVFRGECESLAGDRGLFHQSASSGSTRIVLRHLLDPVQGYSLELYRTSPQGAESRAHFLFNPAEALGVTEAIAGAMSVICFGIPMVIPRDTSAYEAANRERRNATAA